MIAAEKTLEQLDVMNNHELWSVCFGIGLRDCLSLDRESLLDLLLLHGGKVQKHLERRLVS